MAKPKRTIEDIGPAPKVCRGARNEDPSAALGLLETLTKARKPGHPFPSDPDEFAEAKKRAQAVLRVAKRLGEEATTSDLLSALFAEGELAAARAIDKATRAGCGNDVRPEILADGQFDGQPHEIECSACGMRFTYSRLEEEAA